MRMSVDSTLAAQVQQLVDIEAIKQLKYRYIRLADAHRFEEWGQTLSEDCYLSTVDIGTWEGRANIVAAVARSYGEAKTIHHVHMPEINITGPDSASGVWAIDDYATFKFDGKDVIDWGRGYYEELYVRTAEGWRIKRTVLTRNALSAPNMDKIAALK
jgi:hypothetical protein